MPALLARLAAGLVLVLVLLVIFLGPSGAADLLGKTKRDRTRTLFAIILFCAIVAAVVGIIGSTTY